LQDLIEMQFQMGYNFHCNPTSFENCDFFEFQLLFKRLGEQKAAEQKAKQDGQGGMNLESLFGVGK